MSNEYGNDFITLEDEDGVEYELEHLDTFDHKEHTFMVFADAETVNNDEVEIVIFKVTEEDGEELLEAIEDEALRDEVYEVFLEREESGEEDEASSEK